MKTLAEACQPVNDVGDHKLKLLAAGNRVPGTTGRRPGDRFRRLDETVFDDATTNPEAAYYVGLVMADGCISKRMPPHASELILALTVTDIAHVYDFRSFLKADHKVSVSKSSGGFAGNPSARLAVRSNRLIEALGKYGVGPRKSMTAKVSGLEENPHYWRGMVCGDGHLFVAKDNKPVLGLTGSYATAEQFAEFVKGRTRATASIHKNGTGSWHVSVKCSPAFELVKILFGCGGPALARKKEMAEVILRDHSRFEKAEPRNDWSWITADLLTELHGRFGNWNAVARHMGVYPSTVRYARHRLGIFDWARGPYK